MGCIVYWIVPIWPLDTGHVKPSLSLLDYMRTYCVAQLSPELSFRHHVGTGHHRVHPMHDWSSRVVHVMLPQQLDRTELSPKRNLRPVPGQRLMRMSIRHLSSMCCVGCMGGVGRMSRVGCVGHVSRLSCVGCMSLCMCMPRPLVRHGDICRL